MNAIVVQNRYVPAAQTAAGIIQTVLGSLRGTDPALIQKWVLTETEQGDAWLFAVVDDLQIQSYQPWVNALHALSTSLRGRPVFISNTTGFRYGILLSERPTMPSELTFPGSTPGGVQIGIRSNGRTMSMTWDQLGHVLVAGQTQYGKSNFLRLLTLQARASGYRFLLADLDGRTFSQMKGDERLMLPIANTREGFEQVIETALAELGKRARLFDEAGGVVDNLKDYNAQAETKLEPILVEMDEFSSVILGMGGPKSKFAEKATELAWRGLKFGIQIVVAGQDFTKEIVGPIREQMRTRLCFRVATAEISSVVIGRHGAELIRQPGRAMMPTGLVQTYLVTKDALANTAMPGPQMSDAEKSLMEKLWSHANGRADLEKMMEYGGMPERAARALREDWMRRGLAEKRGDRNNAIYLVQTPWTSEPVQTVSERPNGVQTDMDGGEQ